MQIGVKNISNLERELEVSIPPEQIDTEIVKRLHDLSDKVKIPGFRPGKVPFEVVQKRYKNAVLGDVLEGVIKSSCTAALEREKLYPASVPQIKTDPYQAGKPFHYTATFEIYPEIKLADFSEIEVEKLSAEITEQDLDEAIEMFRKQSATWHEADRAAQVGDQVVIDYVGLIDGAVFKDGEANNRRVTLGNGTLLPDFEKHLIGAKAGEEHKFNFTYSQDYPEQDLAGKEVAFTVKVHKVLAAKLPPVDEKFVRDLGVKEGSVEALRAEISKNMHLELENALRKRLHNAIFDALIKMNPVELPKALIEHEIERLKEHNKHLRQNRAQYFNLKLEDIAAPKDEQFIEEARRNVAASLLLGEVVKAFDIKPDASRVRDKIERMAQAYQNPEEIVKWYYKNKEQLSHMEFLVLEEQAIESMQEKIKFIEKQVSYKEALGGQP